MCLFECTCLDHLFGVSGRMVCQFGQSSQETHWMVLVYEQVDKKYMNNLCMMYRLHYI